MSYIHAPRERRLYPRANPIFIFYFNAANMPKKETTQRVSISERRIGFDTPMVVNQLTDSCLYSGFFGRLDSARVKSITDDILDAMEHTANDSIVVDLSNVDIIDSAVAAHLIRTGDVIRLIGCHVIFCGINTRVAQTMVSVGVEFSKYHVCKDLKSALRVVFDLHGLMLVPVTKIRVPVQAFQASSEIHGV